MVIKNQWLSAEISEYGAELRSLKAADGLEYLWQGDPAYWEDRAPVLFPWVGRLMDGRYRYRGETYEMGLHGFAWKSNFTYWEQREDSVTLVLESDPETKRQYPFDFRFSVTYTLREKTLEVTFAATNTGSRTMYFAWGGHPGFNVPLAEGETMADYSLTFSHPCHPERVLLSDNVLPTGQTVPFPLQEDRWLQPEHRLFDHFVVFLAHGAREATLRSRKSGRGVRVSYPDMPYLGLWHVAKSEAPFLCLEPSSSLPGREGILEDLSCRSDLLSVAPGKTKQTSWSIDIF